MGRLESREVLIDSSVIIRNLRDSRSRRQSLLEKASEKFDFLYVSAISVYEVECGAKVAGRHSDIEPFLAYLQVLEVNERIAKEAASIYAELKRRNNLIGGQDILIAGTSRAFNLPLLTNNLSHFKPISGIFVYDSV